MRVYLMSTISVSPLNATYLPTVNTRCVSAINGLRYDIGLLPDYQSVCTSTCQSFYNLYSSCYSPQQADAYFGKYCGSYNATTYCPGVVYNTAYQNVINLVTLSCSGTTCTSSCMSAVVAADTYAGCCVADAINAAKVTCGLNHAGVPVPPTSALQQLRAMNARILAAILPL